MQTVYFIPLQYGPGVWPDGRAPAAVLTSAGTRPPRKKTRVGSGTLSAGGSYVASPLRQRDDGTGAGARWSEGGGGGGAARVGVPRAELLSEGSPQMWKLNFLLVAMRTAVSHWVGRPGKDSQRSREIQKTAPPTTDCNTALTLQVAKTSRRTPMLRDVIFFRFCAIFLMSINKEKAQLMIRKNIQTNSETP